MKMNLLQIGILAAVLTFFLFSCGKKNQESGLTTDTAKTDVSGKSDTSGITNPENLTANVNKTDTIPADKLKNKRDTSNTIAEKKDKVKVIAYYFHPTARCPSCINIENFTKEVIESEFSKESVKGLISFRQLNIEDSLNEHYIDDYKLEFSSVILAKFINNKQVEWKNLEHVWKYSGNKESFFKYMKIEVNQFLKEKKEDNNG